MEQRTANQYYMEAMKQGTGESLMALVGGNNGKEGQHGGVLQALGSVDERQDGAGEGQSAQCEEGLPVSCGCCLRVCCCLSSIISPHQALSMLPTGLIIINAAGIIMACNKAALCMFGVRRASLGICSGLT
jgi:hypothetical protein